MRLREHIIALTEEAFPVKKFSKRQSRKHIKKRKAKVAARHAKAGHWTAQAQPMFGSGKVHYEVGGNTEVMSSGGMLARRKRKQRELQEAHYGTPRRVQWDLARSRLVF